MTDESARPGGPAAGSPGWPPVPASSQGRPIPQWLGLEAGHADDLTVGTSSGG